MERILIVDDEPDILELLKDTFACSRFEVVTACNAEEFREQIQQRRFDAIILDIVLGDHDGTILYNRFVDEEGLDPRIPVIFLSALAGDKPSHLPQRGRVYLLIGKPFEPDKLVQQVEKLLAA